MGMKEFKYGDSCPPLVSVVVPTRRYGPVYEVLFSGLKNQTLKEWELLIVDDVPEDRSGLAETYAKRYGLNVKWMRSKPNYWRSNRLIANARNTALIYAEGELVVFVDDFMWVPPRFLESHWRLWNDTGYNLIGSVTAVQYTPNPPEDLSTLPVYTYDERIKRAYKGEDYIKALQAGYPTPGAVDTRVYLGYRDLKGCPPGWFYTCLTSGNMVYTSCGPKDISEVRVGDMVLSHDGNHHKVTCTFKCEYRGGGIRVTPSLLSFPINCTPDHLFLVKRGDKLGWVSASHLRENDYLVAPRLNSLNVTTIDLPAPGIEYGDLVYLVNKNQYGASYRIGKPIPRQIHLSPEWMQLFGLYIAEGNINRDDTIYLTFGKHEKKLAQDAVELFRKLGFHSYIAKVERANRVTCTRKTLAQAFLNMFGGHAYEKRIYPPLMHSPYIRYLLLGLFQGDGSHRIESRRGGRKQGHLFFTTTSETLAHQMVELLLCLGIVPSVGKYHYMEKDDCQRHPFFLFRVSGEHYIQLAHQLGINAIREIRHHRKNRSSVEDKYCLIPIRSIEKIQLNEPVYDITVDGTSSFVVNGIVVHNCNASAPLAKIVEVNGFDEEFDATSEEDVDLGLRLARVGCRFWFKSNPDVNAYHMTHGLPELNPPLRYKPEECHRVTKGMYNELEGSHALIKRNSQRPPWKVNEGIFDLKAARLEA